MCAVVSAACTASSRQAMRVQDVYCPRISRQVTGGQADAAPIVGPPRKGVGWRALFEPIEAPWYEPRRGIDLRRRHLCIALSARPSRRTGRCA